MRKNILHTTSYTLIAITVLTFNSANIADELSIPQATHYLERSFPNAKIDRLRASEMPGVYEIVIAGSVYYLTEDGKFLLAGSLYDLESGEDMTQQAYKKMRRDSVARLAEKEAITYAPPKYQYTINVFSDADCPSCRNFHSQIKQVNALGIRVRYFLSPYLGDAAYQKAISIWCADDRNRALDQAKLGRSISDKQCANPIDENLRIAETLGIKGTPSFLLEDGSLLQGYRTPHVLLDEVRK